MYFESVFIEHKNFYINIYNINLSKKFMKITFFLASKMSRPRKFFFNVIFVKRNALVTI